MNVARIALFLILTLLAIVIFFALTGLDVRNPMPAVERMIAWTGQFNRTINARINAFFYRLRVRIFGGETPSPPQDLGVDQAVGPLERLGRSLSSFFSSIFRDLFSGARESFRDDFVEPLRP